MTGIRLAEASQAFAFQSMDTLTKRMPEITVFTMAGTADVNIACCMTNVHHFSLFHDNKILTLVRE